MKNPKTIAGLVIGLLFLIFLFQNMDYVPLRFYFWERSIPKIILIPVAILVGFVAGYVTAKIRGRPRKTAAGKDLQTPSPAASGPSSPGKEQGPAGRI